MADEIKLGLNIGDTYQVLARLTDGLKQVDKAAKDVAESYEVLAGAGANYSQIEAASDRAVASAVEQTRAQKAIRSSLDEIPASATKAAKGIGDFKFEILNAGRAAQDFAQGGVAGILNNIEGLLIKFPVAAGVVTAFATAAYVAAPAIYGMYKAWQEGANEIPKNAEGLKGLNDALAEQKKRLKELAEQQTLTNAELAEFKKLNEQVAAAENEKAAAAVKGKESEETQGFKKALEEFGGGKALIDAIAGNDPSRRASVAEDIKNALGGDEKSIGFLKGGNQKFDKLLNQFDPDTIADERFKKIQDEQENRFLADKAEGERKRQEALKRQEEQDTQRDLQKDARDQQRQAKEAADAFKNGDQRIQDGRDSADLRKIANREYGYNPGAEMGDILKNARKYVDAGADPGQAARAAIGEMMQTMNAIQQKVAGMNGFWNGVQKQAQITRSRMSRVRPG